MATDFKRLDVSAVYPIKYVLDYKRVDLVNCVFEGNARIELSVVNNEATHSTITLHAVDLHLSNVHLCTAKNEKLNCKSISFDLEMQTATFDFGTDIVAFMKNNISTALVIDFQGILNDNLAGFYRSSYMVEGVSRIMATTQFEPTDARLALPCFDEPNIKAVFQVRITIPHDRIAISNTPALSTKHHTRKMLNGKSEKVITYQFGETPKMSTYLLAFVVGEFDVVSKYSTKSRILTQVYTPYGKTTAGQYALDVACSALDFYQDLFGVDYPLQKSDLLAIPDFAAGAMENWGCVTYRESRVLVDDKNTSMASKMGISRTVCHELAHQWFGNLVTMDWWSDLWLNEGFARYMEFLAVDFIFPEMNVWTTFLQDVIGTAMRVDSLKSTHPVQVEVYNPSEINEIFDIISYAKGASIIHMLSSFVKRDKFIEGVKIYLRKYQYANAKTCNLWECINEAFAHRRIDISQLMETWTKQEGYPLIKFTSAGGGINCVVKRFFASQKEATAHGDKEDNIWMIPISLLTSYNGQIQTMDFLINPNDKNPANDLFVMLQMVNECTMQKCWFIMNSGMAGFYRTCYTEQQYNDILELYKADLSIVDSHTRLGILRDLHACCKSGDTSITNLLNYLEKSLQFEVNPAVCLEHVRILNTLQSLFRYESFNVQLKAFVYKLCIPIFSKLSWQASDGDSNQVISLRSAVINVISNVIEDICIISGDEKNSKIEFMNEVNSMFISHYKNEKLLPSDIRAVVFKIIAKTATIENGNLTKLMHLFTNKDGTSMTDEKRHILATIGFVNVDSLQQQVIDFVLGDQVRKQDIPSGMYSICSNWSGAQKIWNRMTSDFDAFKNYLGDGFLWGHSISYIVGGLKTAEEVSQVKDFFTTHEIGSAKKKLSQALESVGINIEQVSRDKEMVSNFLQSCSLSNL